MSWLKGHFSFKNLVFFLVLLCGFFSIVDFVVLVFFFTPFQGNMWWVGFICCLFYQKEKAEELYWLKICFSFVGKVYCCMMV
jgi:hypothetical protein